MDVALTEEQFELVRRIVLKYADAKRNRPVIFGSRATGTAKRYSDLDIGFCGEPLAWARLGAMRAEFDDSSLPYVVDLVNFDLAGDRFAESALEGVVEIK
ncbi:MAG: nucleotidyltransferase domain-containing protein [Actinobacteria bacterium]|nr:nucleotidyltransferase domain-containing protein [Actinomycetota bacterium]